MVFNNNYLGLFYLEKKVTKNPKQKKNTNPQLSIFLSSTGMMEFSLFGISYVSIIICPAFDKM